MQITSNKKFELVGRGIVTLSPNDHLATGGEGSVYRVSGSDTVVKLYTDLQKMRRDGMDEKLQLLAKIQSPYVVSPTNLVLYSGEPVGYYMPFVSGEALSSIFTTGWRDREGFDDKNAITLVDRMREAVRAAHAANAVMVDANELNWIAKIQKRKGPEPLAVDVDAWAIGRWPASVIMPSIRDWSSQKFTSLSDWFSWAIVTFQVFTGIHPYKGGLDGYKPSELERRMKENASVFSTGIRLNNAVRDFGCIPGPLLNWYETVFQKGHRSIPPSPFETGVAMAKAVKTARVTVTSSGALLYTKVFSEVNDPVINVFSCGVALLKSGKLFDITNRRQIGHTEDSKCLIVRQEDFWIKAEHDANGALKATSINCVNFEEKSLDVSILGRDFFSESNRLFIINDKGLTEVTLKNFGKKQLLVAGSTWGVMVNSTRWYRNVGIQDAMGATFAILPFGEKSCAQVRVKELDGLRSVDAVAGNRFVSIITVNKQGQYEKIELTFDRDYKTYQVWKGFSDVPELNMTALPKGVVATIINDGTLNIFVPTSGNLSKFQDSQVSTTMALCRHDDTVLYIEKGDVWRLKTR